MAHIHYKKSKLQNHADFLLTAAICLFLPSAFLVPFFILHAMHHQLNYVGLVMVLLSFPAGYLFNKQFVIRYGLRGEKKTLQLLKQLSDDFHVFNNVYISSEKGNAEIDILVLSPDGCLAIEVKNHVGEISGYIDDRFWKQTKTGKYGRKYIHELYNPTKQVKKQVFKLSFYLKEIGKSVWIQPVVYFANPSATNRIRVPFVHNNQTSVPVFFSEKNLIDYIEKYKKTKSKISDAQIKTLADVLGDRKIR